MKKQAILSASYRNRGFASGHTAGALASMLAGLLLLGGCNKAPAPAPDATAQATPAPAPAPAANPPAETTPAPAVAAPPPAPATPPPPPPPPPPKVYTVPAGTPLVVRLEQTVSAKNNNVGDTFTGVLAQSVRVQGVTVIKAGAPATGTVVASKGQGRFKGDGALGIAIRRVGSYSVSTSSYEKSISGKGKRSTGFIAGGGGGGALIGGLAGGGKGALIGGLLGAGAGTAGAAFTGNKDVSVPAESVVTFNLTAPITVTLASQ
jgi:hypothetical protein